MSATSLWRQPCVAEAHALTFLATTHRQLQPSATSEGGMSRFTLPETQDKNDRDKSLLTTEPEQRQSVMVELCDDFNFCGRKLILLSRLIAQYRGCFSLTINLMYKKTPEKQ